MKNKMIVSNWREMIKDLEDENKLLLLQLHQVQEELEINLLKSRDENFVEPNDWTSDNLNQSASDTNRLCDALFEIERLQNLLAVYAEINDIEFKNSISNKLGSMLIDASGSMVGIFKLPFRLIRFWKIVCQTRVPKALGGKEFGEVVRVYKESSFEGVESLLKCYELSPTVKSDAYTALARYLNKMDVKAAAEAAKFAFEIDPKQYRLKWLAYRVHESGDSIKAEAIIEFLNPDCSFSDSEKRTNALIKHNAKNARRLSVAKKMAFEI